MRQTKKSDLGEILESLVPKCIELLPFNKGLSVHIRDLMGIIHATDLSQFSTFGQVVYNYRKWLLVGFCMADTLVYVFDRHIDDSVKAIEMAIPLNSTK